MNTFDYFNKLKEPLEDKYKETTKAVLDVYSSCVSKKEDIDYRGSIKKTPSSFININERTLWDTEKVIEDPILSNSIKSPLHFVNGEITHRVVVDIEELTMGVKCYVSDGVSMDLSNAIDNSSRTRATTKALYKDIAGHYVLNDKDNTVIKKKGAFVEVCIELPFVKKINSLRIECDSFYPQNLAYIKYSKTDNDYHKEELIESYEYINKKLSLSFETITCKKIYLGIVQTHYKLTSSSIGGQVSSCYSYDLSIRDIKASYQLFEESSASSTYYITNTKYPNDFRMYVDEEIPKECSSEYYITFDGTSYTGILPFGTDIVRERLAPRRGLCKLRFRASTVKNVFVDGTPISDYTLRYVNDDIVGIMLSSAPSAVYTIEYTPSRSAKIKNSNTNNTDFIIHNETIKCNDKSSYELSLTPAFNGIEVEILDTLKGRVFKGDKVKSIDNNSSFSNKKFQYTVEGNYLVFTRELDDRYMLNVKYKVYNNNFKIMTILRRNNNKSLETRCVVRNINILIKE